MTKEELRQWMDDRGYTAITLAEALDEGTHRTTVHRWLNGTAKIPPLLSLALEALDARQGRRRR